MYVYEVNGFDGLIRVYYFKILSEIYIIGKYFNVT